MVLNTLFFSALEDALNRYIGMDPDAGLFLRPLCGKVIAVKLAGLARAFYLCPCEDGIQLLREFGGEPDTTLIGSPLAFGTMVLSDVPARTLFSGKVTMQGDVDTGRKLQAFFAKLDIDLEEQLSTFTGDIVAHKLGNLVRERHAWCRESLDTFRMNLSEFLQEEARDLPTRVETEIFFNDVDRIRSACDRMEARVMRLHEAVALARG